MARRSQVEEQYQENVIVYKLVAMIEGQRRSVTMPVCSATYTVNEVTCPPIPGSPLFAYRSLEDACQAYDRIVEANAWRRGGNLEIPPMEIWKAITSRTVTGPKRVPEAGAYYVSLFKKCGYGATLADTYIYFWAHLDHCLRYLITKASGIVPHPSTVFCSDLMLLEQIPYPIIAPDRAQPVGSSLL